MWKNYPALFAAAMAAAGILTAHLFPVQWYYYLTPLCVVVPAVVFLWVKENRSEARKEIASVLPGLLIFFSAGSASLAQVTEEQASSVYNFLDSTEPLLFRCRSAEEVRSAERKHSTVIRIMSVITAGDTLPCDAEAVCTYLAKDHSIPPPEFLKYGTQFTLSGIVERPSAARNPGEFSYRDYLALNGISGVVTIRDTLSVSSIVRDERFYFYPGLIYPTRQFVRRVVRSAMDSAEASFLIGLLLGDRSDIPLEVKNAFVNTGTVHVLAVSGSHVVVVVAIFYSLFGLLRFGEKSKIVVTSIGIIFYMFLTGATPSVNRACLMAIIVLSAKFFQQRTNMYNALGASAVILFLIDPRQLFDVGFQLSYGAVFSMIFFIPRLQEWIKKIPASLEEIKSIDAVLQLFAVSLAAQLGTLPFTAFYFGRISIISLFANLIVVPLVGLIVIIGFVSLLFGMLSSTIAIIFGEANRVLIWFVLQFVLLADKVPSASVIIPVFGITETLYYCIAVILIFSIGTPVIFRRSLLALFVMINWSVLDASFSDSINGFRHLQVTFLDVGQGDAILLELPGNEKMLIDTGPIGRNSNAGEKVIVPYLLKNGISKLDAVVLTHADGDHLGGMKYIVENISIDKLIDPGIEVKTELFRNYSALRKNKSVLAAETGKIIPSSASVRMYILHPQAFVSGIDSADIDINNQSVIIKLVYGSTSFLFTGDVEIPAEKLIVKRYGDFLQSDILKAGHHGSRTSSSEELLDMANPSTAVISVGRYNKFRHPSKIVLDRFKKRRTTVLRTDHEGAVILTSDGKTITRRRWRME